MFEYTEEEFDVTQAFIDDGMPDSPLVCALALAARNLFNHPVEVGVDYMRVKVTYEKFYHMDEYLKDWTRDFDNDKTSVGPIRVALYKEDHRLRVGIVGEDI